MCRIINKPTPNKTRLRASSQKLKIDKNNFFNHIKLGRTISARVYKYMGNYYFYLFVNGVGAQAGGYVLYAVSVWGGIFYCRNGAPI